MAKASKYGMNQAKPKRVIDLYEVPKNEKHLGRLLKNKDWRMNNLWTVVDRSGKAVPFRQNAAQRRFFLNKHLCNVIYKDRQRGFTTEESIDMLDDAFFTPNLACGIIAHRMASATKIFDTKIRFPYESLPDFIKVLNPVVEFDKHHVKFKNGSSIHVDISFRSDTIHRLLISEWAAICSKFPLRAIEIKTGAMEAVHPQLGGEITVESTSDGGAGDFYELCKGAEIDTKAAEREGRPLGPLQYKRHSFFWHQDSSKATDPLGITISPRLQKYFNDLRTKYGVELSPEQMAWYAVKRDGPNGLGKRMKQEHPSTADEAFEGSVEGAVYGEEILDATEDGRIGRFPYIPTKPVYVAKDLGISTGNADCSIFFQLNDPWIDIIDYIEVEGRGMSWVAPAILNRGYAYDHGDTFVYVPHDARNKSRETATPLIETMRQMKLKVSAVVRPQDKDMDGIQAVRNIWSRLRIDTRNLVEELSTQHGGQAPYNHYEGGDRLLKALKYYRYKWDEEGRCYSKVPIHDWASNPADALQTLALAIEYGQVSGEYRGSEPAVSSYYGPDSYEEWRPSLARGRFYADCDPLGN